MTDSDRSAGISYGTQPLLRFEEVAITGGPARHRLRLGLGWGLAHETLGS